MKFLALAPAVPFRFDSIENYLVLQEWNLFSTNGARGVNEERSGCLARFFLFIHPDAGVYQNGALDPMLASSCLLSFR